jgi:uncharacterized protein (TIGR03435 family)
MNTRKLSPWLIALSVCAVFGQTDTSPRFEVASIKLHHGPPPTSNWRTVSGSRILFRSATLRGLVLYAFGLQTYEVPGIRSLDNDPYDLEADVGDGRVRTLEEFRPMMQTLLAERYKFVAHRETRDMPVYALVVGKGGLKLKESAPDAVESRTFSYGGGRNVKLRATGLTMESFASLISNHDQMDRPILNKTGLAGRYDFELRYVPEYQRAGPGPHDSSDETDVFGVVREQLGLRLEPMKMPVDVLVVDHWAKPVEN